MTPRSSFRLTDITRSLKAALKAGLAHPVVTIDPTTGLITVRASAAPADDNQTKNEWDEVSGQPSPPAPQPQRNKRATGRKSAPR